MSVQDFNPDETFKSWLARALQRSRIDRKTFVFLGGDPPEIPPGIPLVTIVPRNGVLGAGDPFWELIRYFLPEKDLRKTRQVLREAGFRPPLLEGALQSLGFENPLRECPIPEEAAYHRAKLPRLLTGLVEHLASAWGQTAVYDLGETAGWGTLALEVLKNLRSSSLFPGVLLLRVQAHGLHRILSQREVDGDLVRWEPGAFLIPEEDKQALVPGIPQIIRDCRCAFQLGCFEEVAALSRMRPKGRPVGAGLELVLYEGLGRLGLNQVEDAINLFQEGLGAVSGLEDKTLLGEYYLALSRAYSEKGDDETAILLARAALELSLDDPGFRLRAKYRHFLVARGRIVWKNQDANFFTGEFLPLLQELESFGWGAHWADAVTRVSSYIHVNHEKTDPQALILVRKALVIARSDRNSYRLSLGYQTLGVLLQEAVRYQEALEAYTRSYRIRTRVGEEMELARLQVGLGFYHTSLGQYLQGRKYLEKALGRLRKTRDYGEIAAALFNLGVNAYFAGHPAQGIEPLSQGLNLMNQAGLSNLPFTHRIDFHAVLGLCFYTLGQRGTAFEQYNTARSLLARQGEDLKLLLLVELQGLLHRDYRILDGLLANLEENLEPQRHIYIDAVLRYSELLAKNNDTFKAQGLMEKALKWIGNRPIYPWQKKIFSGEVPLNFGTGYGQWPTAKNLRLDVPFLLVQQDRHLKTLHRQYHFTRFLNEIHLTTGPHVDEQSLLPLFLDRLFQYFPLRESWILFQMPGKEDIFFYRRAPFIQDRGLKPADFRSHDLVESQGTGSLEKSPWKEAFPRGETGFWVPLEGGHGGKGLLIGVTNTEAPTDQEGLQAISLGVHQALMALELRTAWARLEKSAQQDSLTGFLSRATLPKRFKDLSLQRGLKHQNWMSLIYLDLDNFKQINDNFGHASGDRVLVWFSGEIQGLIRSADSAFRVGGDEFVLILPGEKQEGAKSLAERILGLFQKLPADLKVLQAGLDPSRRLGCSLGIHSGIVSPGETLDKWLSLADAALYQAKNQGKNTYSFNQTQEAEFGNSNDRKR